MIWVVLRWAANLLTVSRLFVPVLIFHPAFKAMGVEKKLFIILGFLITDAIDGKLARIAEKKTGVKNWFGKFEHAVDKFVITSVIYFVYISARLMFWEGVTIIVGEAMMALAFISLVRKNLGEESLMGLAFKSLIRKNPEDIKKLSEKISGIKVVISGNANAWGKRSHVFYFLMLVFALFPNRFAVHTLFAIGVGCRTISIFLFVRDTKGGES